MARIRPWFRLTPAGRPGNGSAATVAGTRIAMLSQSPWRHDSRVIREAETLAQAGYDVHVLCRADIGAGPSLTSHEGVTYHSIAHSTPDRPQDLLRLLAVHARVLAADARAVARGPARRRRALSALRLFGLALAAPAAPLLLLSLRWRRARAVVARSWASSPAAAAHLRGWLEALSYLNDYARVSRQELSRIRPDIVHAHDLITLSAGAFDGALLLYDAHELETHTNYHTLSPVTKRWIELYERALAPRCDAVLTVSDSIADWLERRYSIPRPHVVLNAPRSPTARTTPGIRRVLGLDNSVPLVVYVGLVTVDRGLELCVEALRDLPDVHLATVGPRYSGTEEAMRAAATRFAVQDRLHLIDAVPSADVIPFIESADASILPIQNVCLSYAFCFPNKLLESVFAGLPVAVADLVELRRFVEDNEVGLVMDERTPAGIAGALREVLERRSELRPSRDKISELERRYGWDAQAERLRALYAELTERRARRRAFADSVPSVGRSI